MGGAPATKTRTVFPPNASHANEALIVGVVKDRARRSVNSFIATLVKRSYVGGLYNEQNRFLWLEVHEEQFC